jgi:predicted O-methyltransferase YrrM
MLEQTITPATWKEIERVGKLVRERDDAWAIPRVSGEFLHALVLAGDFRRGLEIGTSYGYSGLWLGAALRHNGGTLLTLDASAVKVKAARAAFARAGLDGTVTAMHGAAEEILPQLPGPFDFVFLDADKPSTRRYFELVWPRLAHRATLVTDNVTSHAEELAAFVAYVRALAGVCSVLLPIGSGLEVTVKLDTDIASGALDGADWVI